MSAFDVRLCVADHHDFAPVDLTTQRLPHPSPGDHRQLVALFMIVPESAKQERLLQSMRGELEGRADAHVAGQQPDQGWIRQRA